MTDQLLGILNVALLALLYLFFARVLWAVWSEVRGPRHRADLAPGTVDGTPHAGSMVPAPAARRAKAPKGKRGRVGRLAVLEPRARRGTAFPIANEVTIGRAPGCTISIPDDTFVSQLHARVFVVNGQVLVEDLGSTNGTYVNTRRVTGAPMPLTRGDRLQAGSTVLEAQ